MPNFVRPPGHKITALCPKTGVVVNNDLEKIKVTSKGLSKQNALTYETYSRVLETGQSACGVNELITPGNNRLRGVPLSQLVKIKALSYAYLKKRVHSDGVTCFSTHA